jgi:hypothetical protein
MDEQKNPVQARAEKRRAEWEAQRIAELGSKLMTASSPKRKPRRGGPKPSR